MNIKIPSRLSQFIHSFDPVTFQDKHRLALQFLFGLTVCKFVDHYLENNFSIAKHHRFHSIQPIPQLISAGIALAAVKHYSRFEPQYLNYTKALNISAQNTLTAFVVPVLTAQLGMSLANRLTALFVTRRNINHDTANTISRCVGVFLGIITLSFLTKRYPLQSLSSQQARWMFLTCLATTLIGALYENGTNAYKAKYALLITTGGGTLIWYAKKFYNNLSSSRWHN